MLGFADALVNQTRRYPEPAGNFGDRGAGCKCRRHNLLTFLVTPAAMTFRSCQKCNLAHAVQLRVLKETSLRAQLSDLTDETQGGLQRRVTLSLQGSQDGSPLGGVFRRLLMIDADDVAHDRAKTPFSSYL